ncbi:rhomboid family intramembrane serine protease [Prosthecomicrobium pneumaticum]|uniref:Membrane associated rhomboid family serine protease n=1 Tax=Prosthecomicrobium pneumaticum TaxID=81895 RepID=A0A7W9FPI3_9HYPH|nr:rhomboid family intramembrane serine protease [Prosthecomicrobium pneumaticum]MBB5754413.1 membrane associated rhomboid family serine protease [Prosthecomicrobium pneumaticum]
MFNLPSVVVATIGVLGLVHLVRTMALDSDTAVRVLLAFAFVPVRLTAPELLGEPWPGGLAGDVWTFVTYAGLHGSWMHFGINALWLAAFGTPLARRFGTVRFLAFFAIGAAAGAAAHLALYPDGLQPLVGASAAISAQMAASARFAFSPGGALGGRRFGAAPEASAALSLREMITDRRIVVFLGVWFAMNLVFGLFLAPPGMESSAIAWEAHLGGFVAGLLLFPLFDPVGRR